MPAAPAPVELLVFGPHPDDLEIGMGGTIARHAAEGCVVGLCDLTRGEMGTNGTPDERLREAEAAREVLGARWRVNLGLPDRRLREDPDQVAAIVELIRTSRPSVIALPYWNDRHPDHVAASVLVQNAAFTAGLRRHVTGQEAWRADWLVYYFINNADTPSFVVDVSAHYDTKQRSLDCHSSQFAPGSDATETRLTSPLFRQLIESRDAQFGALSGVPRAEGFVVREPIVRADVFRRRRDAGAGA
jgi:bacillithiol biosynthesis deacetylase BshB1